MKSKYVKSVTGRTSGKKQVNPTYSAKAPSTKPSNGGRQVNPTAAASKSSSAVSQPKATEVNKTYAVANKGAEKSKGPSNRSRTAAKNAVGKPLATKANPRPVFKAMLKANPKSTMAGKAIPTKNEENTSVGLATSASKTHSKGTSIPTRNENAPSGPNRGITLSRLKKLGFGK